MRTSTTVVRRIRKFYDSCVRHRALTIVTFLVLIVFVDSISHWIDPQLSWFSIAQRSVQGQRTIAKAKVFLGEREALQTDEVIIAERIGLEIPDAKRAFPTDPFLRLNDRTFGPQSVTKGSAVEDLNDLLSRENKYEGTYYELDEGVAQYVTDMTDEVMYKALYCDREGYSTLDALILSKTQDGEGGYGDTHALLGLAILASLDCIDAQDLVRDTDAIVTRLVRAQESAVMDDLFAERVVVLFWAGKGDLVRARWIDMIADAQNTDGGFSFAAGGVSDPHTTALAALALTYARAGENLQDIILP